MNVAVLSFFRNAERTGQVARFFSQAAALRDRLVEQGHRMRVIAVYGDCVDDTEKAIMAYGLDHNLAVTLVEHSHGGPEFGSTEHRDRLVALSAVGNAGLVTIRNQDDAVFYVESDLLWDAETVTGLLSALKEGEVDILAPLVFAGDAFYDIFCFRKNGQRFSPFYPYHPDLKFDGTFTQVDSVGSAFVMTGAVGRDCRIINDNVLLGFCEDAWAKGYTINVDPFQKVQHPA